MKQFRTPEATYEVYKKRVLRYDAIVHLITLTAYHGRTAAGEEGTAIYIEVSGGWKPDLWYKLASDDVKIDFINRKEQVLYGFHMTEEEISALLIKALKKWGLFDLKYHAMLKNRDYLAHTMKTTEC